MTIRLMVTDDHDLFRAGVVQYLQMQPGIEVVAAAAGGEELLGKLRATPVDILLLDMLMPGLSGVGLVTAIKALYPDLRILILSAQYNVQAVLGAMRAGASGYIGKNCSPQMLLEAVKEVMVTGKYLPQDMAERVEYAAVFAPPDHEGIEEQSNAIRLNGKTIGEWKEDCETFYREKADQEKINTELNRKNITVENENFDLKEIIRCAG